MCLESYSKTGLLLTTDLQLFINGPEVLGNMHNQNKAFLMLPEIPWVG